MFIKKVGQPSSLKKFIYLLAATILGVLLSLIAHAVIEINYLSWAASHGMVLSFYGACALAPIIQITLWVAGVLGGFFLGRFWYRIIYIERFWEKRRSK